MQEISTHKQGQTQIANGIETEHRPFYYIQLINATKESYQILIHGRETLSRFQQYVTKCFVNNMHTQ